MPNIKSAKKRVAVTEKKNTQNKMIKSAVKTAVKKYNALLAAGDLAGAEKLLPETVSVIDSAVSKGILHKNNAANKKSALAKNLNSAKAAAEKAAAEENIFRLSRIRLADHLPRGEYAAVVLGCTHYIFLRERIAAFYGCPAFDGNAGTADHLAHIVNICSKNMSETCKIEPIFMGEARKHNKKVYQALI